MSRLTMCSDLSSYLSELRSLRYLRMKHESIQVPADTLRARMPV
jgi:hypothetical protein